GPSAANGATYSDMLPASIGAISASCGGTTGGAVCGALTITGNEVSGVIAVFPVGGSVVITITGKPSVPGILLNTARVSIPPGIVDPNAANDASSTTTSISAPPPSAGVPIPASSRQTLALLALLVLALG